MTCNMCLKNIVISIISTFLISSPVFSTESGGVEYHDYLFDYSHLDPEPLKLEADLWLSQALGEQNINVKNDLLHQAMKNYYILLKISPGDVDVLNKRALIYDIQDKNLLARSFFSRSLNIEKDNPETNYLVGDYFFKRRDFKRALRYFSAAYENGYSGFDINYKLAVVYEKLGDLCNAKHFYQEAYSFDESKSEILDKIQNIPEENEEYHGTIRS